MDRAHTEKYLSQTDSNGENKCWKCDSKIYLGYILFPEPGIKFTTKFKTRIFVRE